MSSRPIHEMVLVRHHDRPVPRLPQRLGHRPERGPEGAVVVLPGIGRDPRVGPPVGGCLLVSSPEVERAHHQARRTRQRPRRVGGTLRVAVGELHPRVEPPALALSQNPRRVIEGVRSTHTHGVQPCAPTDLDQGLSSYRHAPIVADSLPVTRYPLPVARCPLPVARCVITVH